jgi:hypothetical protein
MRAAKREPKVSANAAMALPAVKTDIENSKSQRLFSRRVKVVKTGALTA